MPPVAGPVGIMVLPQLSFTEGGTGAVAAAIQATVELPFAGILKSLRSIV